MPPRKVVVGIPVNMPAEVVERAQDLCVRLYRLREEISGDVKNVDAITYNAWCVAIAMELGALSGMAAEDPDGMLAQMFDVAERVKTQAVADIGRTAWTPPS